MAVRYGAGPGLSSKLDEGSADHPESVSSFRAPYGGLDLREQVVAVAGCAHGIGRAAALLLAARGARLLCLDQDLNGVEVLASELTEHGAEAIPQMLDVNVHSDIPVALGRAISEWGRIDALVNCVGITGITNRPSHEVPKEDFESVVQTNLIAAFVLSQAVLTHMVERQYGRIVHVASIAGKEGNAGMVSYSASKAGLIGMVKAQGKEYAKQGITVNALAPAVIRTQLVENMPAAQVEYMESWIPMERCGTLQEVAEIIAWMVSPGASFTTGFTYDLSGGRATY